MQSSLKWSQQVSKKWICFRCGISRGVREYEFSEDGIIRTVLACECCASESHIDDLEAEWEKQKLKMKEDSNGKSDNK